MRKYLKYFVISLVLLFCYSINVNALDCYYVKNYGDVTGDGEADILEAHFRVNDGDSDGKNEGKIVFSGVYGIVESKDDNNNNDSEDLPLLYRTIKGQGQKIENWNTSFDPGIDGVGYNNEFKGYDNWYKDKKTCPPYAILIDRAGQFDFVVSDEANKASFEKYKGSKQGGAVLILKPMSEDTVNYYPSSCLGLNKASCELNKNFACVWNEEYGYCNVDNLLYVGCGDARDIPIQVPTLISFLVNLLKIVTPIILIFMGIITLVKAIATSKEDEIKKAQGGLVKKLIAAAMVFFVVTIVQFVISLVADAEYKSDVNGETEKKNLSSCLECFLDGNCDKTAYYKTNIAGKDYCTDLGSDNFDLCPEEKIQ